MPKLKVMEKGKLYRTKKPLNFKKDHVRNDRNIITEIPSQSIVCFMGFHPSSQKVVHLVYGEVVGWVLLGRKETLDQMFCKPKGSEEL